MECKSYEVSVLGIEGVWGVFSGAGRSQTTFRIPNFPVHYTISLQYLLYILGLISSLTPTKVGYIFIMMFSNLLLQHSSLLCTQLHDLCTIFTTVLLPTIIFTFEYRSTLRTLSIYYSCTLTQSIKMHLPRCFAYHTSTQSILYSILYSILSTVYGAELCILLFTIVIIRYVYTILFRASSTF